MAAILRTFWCKYISAKRHRTTDQGPGTRDQRPGPVAKKESNWKGDRFWLRKRKKWRRQQTAAENRNR